MKHQGESDGMSVTEEVARSFLLGELDSSERQRVERLFVTDDEIRETILLVEDDLREDYLEGNLTAADAEKFLGTYATNPREHRKLRITQAISEYAIAHSTSYSKHASVFERMRFSLTRRPTHWRIGVPLFATLLIVVTVAAVWIGVRMNRTARKQNEQVSIERQVAELNSRSNMSVKPLGMLSTAVAPISVRSAQPSAELSIPPGSQIIELRLLWSQKEEYASYQAELSRVGGAKLFNLPRLQLEKDGGGRLVRLRLPTEHLPGGLYRITLQGLRPEGVGPSEEYDFLVSPK